MKEFHRIQNSMIGAISLIQNFRKGNLTIQYVKASNPKKASEIKKGDKIYDYDNAKYFSLNLRESQMILEYLTHVLKSNFKEAEFEIAHFPEGGVHKLVLSCVPGKSRLLIQIAYLENKSVKNSIKLMLDKYDIYVFIDFLKTHAMVKTLSNYNKDLYRQRNYNNNNENNRNNTNTNNEQVNRNTPTPQEDRPIDETMLDGDLF